MGEARGQTPAANLPWQVRLHEPPLLKMARSGDPMFELPDAPRLLQVDSRQDALHFVDPAGETPGRRPVAKLRR